MYALHCNRNLLSLYFEKNFEDSCLMDVSRLGTGLSQWLCIIDVSRLITCNTKACEKWMSTALVECGTVYRLLCCKTGG